jgi:zinc transport system permease protein
MPEILQYDFMIRALIAGVIVAAVAPVVGAFLVVRRYALMADTLSHVSLVGISIGIVAGTQPLLTSVLVTVIAAVVMERLRETGRFMGESLLSLFLSGSLALAVVIASFKGNQANLLYGYLFGSLTTVSPDEVLAIGVLGGIVLVAIAFLYRPLFAVSFDQDFARVSGIPVRFVNTVLVVLSALTVALSIRVVGVLLIGALMVIPVLTASRFARSFLGTVLHGIALSLISVILGVVVSYYMDLPSGATIVLLLTAAFAIAAGGTTGRK